MNLLTHNRLISLALPPALWAAHFVLSYVLVSLACVYDATASRLFGLDTAIFAIATATIAVLLILGYAGNANYHKWLAVDSNNDDASMGRFFAMTSLMLCVLSAIAVLLTGIPVLILPNCNF